MRWFKRVGENYDLILDLSVTDRHGNSLMIREAKAYWVIKANNLERAIKKEATLRHARRREALKRDIPAKGRFQERVGQIMTAIFAS